MQHYSAYIHTDKNILGGKPIIKGTRLSVELLVKRLADGWTIPQLYESYPRLKEEHIQAIFAYKELINKYYFTYSSLCKK